VKALLELLRSSFINSHTSLVVDTRRLWQLVSTQDVCALLRIDAVLLKSLREEPAGLSPVHKAVIMGIAELVSFLVCDKGCDVNSMFSQGQTPLHLALKLERLEVERSLLELGADPNFEDFEGRTPFTNVPKYVQRRVLGEGIGTQRWEGIDDETELVASDLHFDEVLGEGATAVVFSGSFNGKLVAIKEFKTRDI
jgi:ankyrin repeat protein